MSIIDTPKGQQNFKVNLWLSNVRNCKQRLTAFKKCMDLSNKECENCN